MSDISADDYARLATEIGMVCECEAGGFWREALGVGRSGIVALDADLPAYLAEPAQMERILKLDGLFGHAWLIERHDANDWVVSRQSENEDDEPDWHHINGGDTVGAAVRDCAARALRP